MSSRNRVRAAVALAAIAGAALVVGVTKLTDPGKEGAAAATTTTAARKGAPPLALDLGLRDDPEATALRRAAALLSKGKRAQAAVIFDRYGSLQAQLGSAFAGWGPSSVQRVQSLSRAHAASALARLDLGIALLWAGRDAEAKAAWRETARLEPDSASAVHASDLLHPNTPTGLPFFVPTFGTPPAISELASTKLQYAALERAARQPDPHAKILWGIALQRLGRPLSAERQFADAARLAPNDADALTAAAVGRYTKDDPSRAFSRLGPLAKRFPHDPTVRFHLGLLLIWIGDLQRAKHELQLARDAGGKSPLAREANTLLARL